MAQYINKDTYVGDTGKQLKDITKIQEQNMNVISNNTNGKWVKICNIKHAYHNQGEFSFIKIFIGDGNNGRVDQNAYIDLICQLGWTGSSNGRYGCNAELHGFLTGFTIDNTKIKVLANSNIDYDVWFYSNQTYNRINYIVNTSKNTIVTTKGELSSTEPTGTECDLSYNGTTLPYNLTTGATPIKTGRKIDGHDEYVKRYYTSTTSLTQTNSVVISSGLVLSQINVIKIEGVIKSNSDNIFSINAPNNYGGFVYCFFRASDNKIVITCSSVNYQKGAYIDVYFTYKN